MKLKKYEIGACRRTDVILFAALFIVTLAFSLVCHSVFYGWEGLGSYSTSLYAFSYSDLGFCSRTLTGSIYRLFCGIFPGLYGWKPLFYIILAKALLFDVCLFFFFLYLQKKAGTAYKPTFIITAFTMFFLVPSLTACENLGKPDIIQMMIVMLQVYLILEHKVEWSIPVLSFVNVCIHEGFFCMNANVVISILLLYACSRDENKRKYWLLFAANFAVMAVFSVYFVFNAPSATKEVYDKLYAIAADLNKSGAVHANLILQRVKLSAAQAGATTGLVSDSVFKVGEMRRLPFILILFSPYIIYLVREIVNLIRKSERKFFYLLYFLSGVALILVEFYLFCDFGRYFVWLIFFFGITIPVALRKEKGYTSVLEGKKVWLLLLLGAYSTILIPLYSCTYSPFVDMLIYHFHLPF